MLLDERRRLLRLKVGARRPPQMAFLENPEIGKTMVARALGKILHMVGILPTDGVTEVQRTYLAGEFVGHTGPKQESEPMKRVISSNEGFCRRVARFFQFDYLCSKDLTHILLLKMSNQAENSQLYGFKFHPLCSIEAITSLIERETTEKQRKEILNFRYLLPRHVSRFIFANHIRHFFFCIEDVQSKDLVSLRYAYVLLSKSFFLPPQGCCHDL